MPKVSEAVSDTIEVTSSEARVLEVVERHAKAGEMISVADIIKETGLSRSSVNTSFYGRKNSSDGLFKKVPQMRAFILMIKRSKQPQKYNISFFRDFAAEIATPTRRVKTPDFVKNKEE